MKTKLLFQLTFFFFLIGTYQEGFAQSTDTSGLKTGPLFKSDEIFHVKLAADFRAIQKDRGDEASYHDALLTYVDTQGDSVQLPLKVRARGNFRRKSGVCSLPPLLLNFPEKKVGNTVFEKQNKLKLVTRCQFEEYVSQEYMVYKLYNLLTEYSFKARMALITYEDLSGKRKSETSYGFVIEDEELLAQRHQSTLRGKAVRTNMNVTDHIGMATLAVFQYMIGNTDWSVPYQHNIKLLERPSGLPMPIAYDFDHAGIVEAGYAFPAQELKLRSTRERLYRGYKYSPEIFSTVFDKFNLIKPQVYALYRGNPHLNEKYAARTLKYLDDFYDTINDPKRARAIFMGAEKKGERIEIGGLNNQDR